MRPSRVWIQGIILSLIVIMLGVIQWRADRRLLETHDRLTIRRIHRLADQLLGEAHRTQDDLLLQRTVQAIAAMPGVSWAALIDSENKIIAHSDPSQLGKPWRGTTHAGFVFGYSDSVFRQAIQHEIVRHVVFVALVVSLIFGFCFLIEKNRHTFESALHESSLLLEEEKIRSTRLETSLQHTLAQGISWMQMAIEYCPQAALFLNSQQRVVAMNQAGLVPFGFSRSDEALQKSWHEIPILQSCGDLLEQSLLTPLIEQLFQTHGLQLSLITLKEGAGTWVRLFPSNHIVK